MTGFDQLPARHLTIERYQIYDSGVASGKGRDLGLAELVALLSLGTDLGLGQPMEHMVRACLVALRLAEQLGSGRVAAHSRLLLRAPGVGGLPHRCV